MRFILRLISAMSKPPTFVDEEFVRDVQRGHDGDAFEADDFAVIADFVHFAVQIIDGFEQAFLLVFRTSDAKFAPHDVDLQALWIGAHVSSSGICLTSCSRRLLARADFLFELLVAMEGRSQFLAQLLVVVAQPLA